MSTRAIENALKAVLLGQALPCAWPNQDFAPTIPYLAVDLVLSGTDDRTLDGERPITTGRLIATVVSEKGKSTGDASDAADAVAVLFPMGLRISAGARTITIMQPPHVREGYADGAYWRTAVSVPFQAE